MISMFYSEVIPHLNHPQGYHSRVLYVIPPGLVPTVRKWLRKKFGTRTLFIAYKSISLILEHLTHKSNDHHIKSATAYEIIFILEMALQAGVLFP